MKPDYKNWVPRGLLFLLGGMAIICLALCIVFGMAGLVEKIIDKIKSETGFGKLTVVATGGMAKLVKGEVTCINAVDRTLTLEGLRLIYDLNKKTEA